MKFLLSLILTLNFFTLQAQANYDNNWIFSDINGAVRVNFSSGDPEIILDTLPVTFHYASATISDAQGDLLLYTNGCSIFNADDQIIENGHEINPGRVHDTYCEDYDEPYFSVPQSHVFLPWPKNEDKYVLLHKASELRDTAVNGEFTDVYRSYYSVIDMSLNDGAGEVTEKSILFDDQRIEAAYTVNKHANGTDWWIISGARDTAQLKIYLLDEDGVRLHHVEEAGLVYTLRMRGGDQSVFSPQGDKFYRYSSKLGIQIFDFDRETGALSNFDFIPMPLADQPETNNGTGGLGISPSGQYAYASTRWTIYQYDLWADDIAGSRRFIAEVGNPDDLWEGVHPAALHFQLGPDCKLYNFVGSGIEHHVIHNPDERGLACEWEQGGMQLPFFVFRDQSYFPNFRLGPVGDEGSPCAEPIVSTTGGYVNPAPVIEVYPNPAGGFVNIRLDGGGEGLNEGRWALYTASGRKVAGVRVRAGSSAVFQRNGLPAGMYYWRLSGAGRVVRSGKLVFE